MTIEDKRTIDDSDVMAWAETFTSDGTFDGIVGQFAGLTSRTRTDLPRLQF